jgi:sterol desaturase/sphingolipid hydroxylase (fatty acid hydroxylase superfamily)
MMQWVLENQVSLRLSVFLGLFVFMAVLETLSPRRIRSYPRKERWFGNIGIMVLGALFARLVLPLVPVGVALYVLQNQIGLFYYIDFMGSFAIIGGVLFLDFMIYIQHVLMHKIGFLWRLHRLHHADLDYDVTTGIRFHPIEIALSLLYKISLVAIFGVNPVSVIIFEVILNGMAMFNHANFKIPLAIDKVLRLFFITPDVHRIHHSSLQNETDSNYGFNISWWDRLFKTYRAEPQNGHEGMEIGLPYFRHVSDLRLCQMLLQPFKNDTK